MRSSKTIQRLLAGAVMTIGAIVATGQAAEPMGTSFTYQGQLKLSGVPVSETCDFEFTLWNNAIGTLASYKVGPTLTFDGQGGNPAPITVASGLFTADLDFGADAFGGFPAVLDQRWLEIRVACPSGSAFQTLSPRQAIRATPYALQTRGLYVDVDRKIGIGTTTPTNQLSMYGNANIMGYVGIGDATPNSQLSVGNGGKFQVSGFDGDLIFNDDMGTIKFPVTDGVNAPMIQMFAAGFNNGDRMVIAHSQDWPHGLQFEDSTDRFHFINTGGARFMSIDLIQSKVGIGVENPGAKLHIGGTPGADGIMFPDGTLQTTAAGGGSSPWSESGNDVYYNAGKVGVGQASPTARLHIVESLGEETAVQIDTVGGDATALSINATGYPSFGIVASATDTAVFGTSPIEGGTFYASGVGGRGLAGIANASTGAGKGVYGRANSPDGYAGYFDGRGYFTGNVGIGQTNPAAKLHIGGTPSVDGIMFPDGTLQTTAALGGGGGGDGHSLDAADGSPVDALAVDNNGAVTVVNDLTAGDELAAKGKITLTDAMSGTDLASLNRNGDGHGRLVTFADGSSVASAVVGTDTEANGAGGLALLSFDNALGPAVKLDSTANAGRATLARSTGAFTLDETTVLYANAPRTDAPTILSNGGGVDLLNGNGVRTIALRGDDGISGDGGTIQGFDSTGTPVFEVDTQISTGAPNMLLEHPSGGNQSRLFFTVESGGRIDFRNAAGATTISIDADDSTGASGDGVITTQILEITGGSDLSENFDICSPHGKVTPGMVVCIDPDRPGKLVVSHRPYDHTVAGVISGAGGVVPGMRMGQKGSTADGDHPVALTGRTYVFADASAGAIRPGDLMTTSSTPGHAMKVTRHAEATGAILGKAMTSLERGRGLVLVLIALQ